MASRSIIFLLISIVNVSRAANILFINGGISPSHHIYNRVMVLGLAAKGHNVTFLSPDLSKEEKPNVHYIHLEKVYETFGSIVEEEYMLDFADHSAHQSIIEFVPMCEMTCKGILASKGLDVLLNYPNDFKFDAIINDITFGPCLLPLITRFNNPPVIAITAFANPPATTDYVGGHKHPAYVPHWSVTYSTAMTFTERIHNKFLFFVDWISRDRMLYPAFEALVRSRFQFGFPSLKELSLQSSLIFVNTNNVINTPEPLQPNMIQIGGLQIVEPKTLLEEISKFIASGKKGTVLMSLGTNVKSNLLGKERLRVILETFAALPDYNFLWKFESEAEDLPVVPSKNVMLGKFFPQNDILAHPNLVAFVTHSGMLSTSEAYWHGKPMIAVPFFADQHMNSAKAVQLGVGVSVDFRKLSTTFKSGILSVVENPSYLSNAKKVSKLFRDKPMTPLDTAVWWTEYAIRNPNLEFMKSPTIKLGYLASNSCDALIALSAVAVIFVLAALKLINKIRNLCGGTTKAKSKKE